MNARSCLRIVHSYDQINFSIYSVFFCLNNFLTFRFTVVLYLISRKNLNLTLLEFLVFSYQITNILLIKPLDSDKIKVEILQLEVLECQKATTLTFIKYFFQVFPLVLNFLQPIPKLYSDFCLSFRLILILGYLPILVKGLFKNLLQAELLIKLNIT